MNKWTYERAVRMNSFLCRGFPVQEVLRIALSRYKSCVRLKVLLTMECVC